MTRRPPMASAALALALGLAAAVTVFPFYWMLNTSLKPPHEVFLSPPAFASENWTLAAYDTLLRVRPFGRYFLNSLVVSAGSTLLSVVWRRWPPMASRASTSAARARWSCSCSSRRCCRRRC